MRLSKQQALVLATIEGDARPSFAEVSKRTGLRQHQVRHAILRLSALGILASRVAVLNHWKLGFSCYSLNLTTASHSERSRSALLRWLDRSDQVCWYSELGGRFQYSVMLLARRASEVREFLREVNRSSGSSIEHKVVSQRTRIWTFPRRYLAPGLKPNPPRQSGETPSIHLPDGIDEKILREMAAPNIHSESELARRLRMPQATVNRRIRALESAGVIEAIVWLVDLRALGVLRYKVLIVGRSRAADLGEKLLKFAQECLHVTILTESLGEWDYELSIEAFSLDEILLVIASLQDGFAEQISNIELMSVLKFGKFSMFPGKPLSRTSESR